MNINDNINTNIIKYLNTIGFININFNKFIELSNNNLDFYNFIKNNISNVKTSTNNKLITYFDNNKTIEVQRKKLILLKDYNNIYRAYNENYGDCILCTKKNGQFNTDILQNYLHGVIYFYQMTFLKDKTIIPKLYYTGYNNNNKTIYNLIENFDGTLSNLLRDKDVTKFFNKEFFLEILFQLSSNLKLLQNKIQFTHNDLRVDNIFYKKKNNGPISKDNIIIQIGNFKTSRFTIDNIDYHGNIKKINDLNRDILFRKGTDILYFFLMFLKIISGLVISCIQQKRREHYKLIYSEIKNIFNKIRRQSDIYFECFPFSHLTDDDLHQEFWPETILDKLNIL